jgi:hypothetical protein
MFFKKYVYYKHTTGIEWSLFMYVRIDASKMVNQYNSRPETEMSGTSDFVPIAIGIQPD